MCDFRLYFANGYRLDSLFFRLLVSSSFFYQKTKKPSVGADIVLIVLWFVVVFFLIRAFNIIDFKRQHVYVKTLNLTMRK